MTSASDRGAPRRFDEKASEARHRTLVSVVLPACNEHPKLRRTLEQFRATLPPGSEIVVVDNGSTDGSADFLAGPDVVPPSEDPQPVECGDGQDGVAIRLLRYPRPLGVAGARNRGLDHARGEVVVFSDAHNDVPPGWWPPLVAALNRSGVGIVGPGIGIMGMEGVPNSCGQRIVDATLRVEWLPERQLDPYPVPTLGGGCMALRREVLDVTGGFDDGMPQWGSEDLEICVRLWLLGYEVWVVPEVEIPHYFRDRGPYEVKSVNVLHNVMRTAILHFNQERVAYVLHALMQHQNYARALALCSESDVWRRRDELRARRAHDDDWFFQHPYFRDIEMELREVGVVQLVGAR
jgi:glycosyltransferase involved in cell wall biosynthesis